MNWDLVADSPWLLGDHQGIRVFTGQIVWAIEGVPGQTVVSRDGEGGFVWVDLAGLWWLPAGEPRPRLVRADVDQFVRAVPTDEAPAALVHLTDGSPYWVDVETGQPTEPDTPGVVVLPDPTTTPVWYARNGLAAVVTPPEVSYDDEGQPVEVEAPARLIIGPSDTIIIREGAMSVNFAGPHLFDISVSTLESPWARLHDFDGRRIIVSRGPFEPALPEETFLYIDLGCGDCHTLFAAAGTSAALNTVDEAAVPVLDRQPPQLLAAWPGTDEGVDSLTDGVYLGFLDSETNIDEVVFDLAVWFSGPDANRAAIADGETQIPVPNDFYIRNRSKRTFVFEVASGIQATSVWYDYDTDPDLENDPVSWPDLVAAFKSAEGGVWSNLVADPWWITIEGGQVVRMDEQYLP